MYWLFCLPSPVVEMIQERYKRQCVLPGFGKTEQQKLGNCHVVLIGLGGLGASAATALEAMGLGRITAFDGDVVEESNLHRQFIYQIQDVGSAKAEVANRYFRLRRPENQFRFFSRDFTEKDYDFLSDADLVIDGSDRFQTRYLMDACCARMLKPLLSVSLFRFEIQMVLFHVPTGHNDSGFGLSDVFGTSVNTDPQNCSEAGLLGATAGIAGNLMALEAVKFLCMPEQALRNEILYFNTLHYEISRIAYGT